MLPFDFEILATSSPIVAENIFRTLTADTRRKLQILQEAIDAALGLRDDSIQLKDAHHAIAAWAREAVYLWDNPPHDLSDYELAKCRQIHDSLIAICLGLVRSMRYQWQPK